MNMMNSDLLNELLIQTDSIRQIINRMKDAGRISEIDKDLLLDKIRVFYDHSLQLNHSGSEVKKEIIQDSDIIKTEISEKEKVTDKSEAPEPEKLKENENNDSYELLLNEPVDSSENHPAEITTADVIENTQLTNEKPKNLISEPAKIEKIEIQPSLFENHENISENQKPGKVEKEIIQQAFSQKETISDKYQSKNRKSTNELMAELRKDKDLATQMQYKPVKDLREAITLNDRVKYIREIFDQDKSKYDLVVTGLNNCKDLDEAMEYIDANISWDSEKPSFKSFLELIYRRHMPQNN
jgi:hypothetical protein